uniref:protein-tyrosine-phosphatase n=1 Tax=Dermatophagoides pteronyssinus TaxID=6956 RepID=A0A6P6YCH6_DERPT|nr:tyrosine-protein phosphatase Lar-like isoform X2 [Dermatophagoides pteronyssinus]
MNNYPSLSLLSLLSLLLLLLLLQITIFPSIILARSDGHPSRIITPPKDQYVISGRVATFICSAIGTPPPQIEWRKNGRHLTTQRYSVYSFPNGSVLRIEPVKLNRDNATYECLAENGIGEPVRATAILHVYPEEKIPEGFPSFTLQPNMQGVEKGHNALLPCRSIGDPEPQIYWLRDAIPVDMTNPRYSLYQGASLKILQAQEVDEGPYECVAENKIGTAYSEMASLHVRIRVVPPYFTIPPENIYEIMPHKDLNLTCVASGSPLPEVRWRKGNIEMNKDVIPRGRNVLTLTNVKESDNYTCIATSEHGSIEKTAQVIVRSLPGPPTNVQASDVTPTSVRLAWNYDFGSEDIAYFIIQYKPKNAGQFSEISGITTSFYVINSLTPYTEYEFYIIAVNTIGRGQPSTSISITTGETKLGSYPRNVQARPLSSTTIVVQWEPPEEPNGQVTGYKIYYTLNPNLPINLWDVQLVNSNELTTISDLQAQSIYSIRSQAFTTRGAGPLSPPVQVKTQQGVPSQPLNLLASSISATTVQLTWNKPSHTGESIIGYEIYWNDTFTNQEYKRAIPVVETYKLTDLYPDTLYYIWIAAKSRRGEGASTPPIPVKTDQYVPDTPPKEIHIRAISSHSLRIRWQPPEDSSVQHIIYYKIRYREIPIEDDSDDDNDNGGNDEYFKKPEPIQLEKIFEINNSNRDSYPYEFILNDLKHWTQYQVEILAGTKIGDGPASDPIVVRTEEDVPGEPRDVKVLAINSSSVQVHWLHPEDSEHNGLIRGYQIHIQEIDKIGEPNGEQLRFDVADGQAQEFNVTTLQPDTEYSIQVAAVTRKGDGTRSRSVNVKTAGGVPTKPEIFISFLKDDPRMSVKVYWTKPNQTYSQLLEYKLRYGRVDDTVRDEIIMPAAETLKIIENLERGTRYEFRLSGRNSIGWGQESITYLDTPEGVPSSPPQNITDRLQSPTTVVFTWDPPAYQQQNGKITGYGIHFHKLIDIIPTEYNTTNLRMVFSSLDENTEYKFRVRAYTAKGAGPWSDMLQIMTPGDAPPAPTSVQALATSETSVEVWWENMPFFNDILGYTVLYTQIAVEDLDLWFRRELPLTWSSELTGLEPKTMYAIRVAAYTRNGLGRLSELITVRTDPTEVPLNLQSTEVTTHTMTLNWKPPRKLDPVKYKITFGANKEFYDSQGVLQRLKIEPKTIFESSDTTEYKLTKLMPFTTYQVNVTAIPSDDGQIYRPAAKIIVTTAMAAPKPMVKPDTIESKNKQLITVILPQASEEFGLISHYYLVVVPKEFADKEPDLYTIEELSSTPIDKVGPYIAAKWMRRSIPNTFSLGDGQKYHGFINRKLQKNVDYRIFVRAVVDTPQKSLFTSSPFSDLLSLENNMNFMNHEPTRVHITSATYDPKGVPIMGRTGDKSGPILVLSIVLAIMVVVMSIVACIVKHRRQIIKSTLNDTSMKQLIQTIEPQDHMIHPSDPVELRRLNYQTTAMRDHPSIPITELENHIEMLKENDNQKFSQEYESIDPGQQFTWENSNLPVNKPKNRYANVIAYDHSRVVLQPIPGVPGSDYINANYCDAYRKPNSYIATQGPLPETFGDFWRMVWEQNSLSIVMMTKLEERTRIKCDQYWPSKGTEKYGEIEVTLVNYEELATYCIRTFTLKRVGTFDLAREVRQFQFTAWPDHGVPRHPTPFLLFLRRVKTMNPSDAGPLIIHCSAGVGRSGCYIVIDSMLDRIKCEDTIDIYGHVTCLRAQRNYMVQTEDQYIFIYDSVLEAVIAGNTEVTSRDLYKQFQYLMQLVPGENCTNMELEFQKIASMRPNNDENKFISANLQCNKHKNRLMNILPYESTRVFLQPIRGVEGSDYINANFIDGYKYRNAYIATQGPLIETGDDFWRMIWEHNSNIIVTLTQTQEMGREKCHEYWPSERSQRYSYFVVEPITEYNIPQYILREFKITDARDGQSRMIRQFHYVDWPEQGVPKSGEGFIEFITQVHKTKEQFGHEGPITVHCSAGVGRTGVFITLSIVLERLQNEDVLDLFQTVRTLRTQRPGMVQTEDQYQFCYRAILEYISTFDMSA